MIKDSKCYCIPNDLGIQCGYCLYLKKKLIPFDPPAIQWPDDPGPVMTIDEGKEYMRRFR